MSLHMGMYTPIPLMFSQLYVAMQVPRPYSMQRKMKIYCSLNNSILYSRQVIEGMYCTACVISPISRKKPK